MPKKSPSQDRIVVLQGESVDYTVEFEGLGPKGIQVFTNGDLALTDKVHPNTTEWTINPTFEKSGEFTLQIIVTGVDDDDMEKLTSRDPELMANIEEVERANVTWDVVVADPDELYQTNSDLIKELIKNTLALYTAGKIALESVRRLKQNIKSVDRETKDFEHEMSTLDDFLDSKSATSTDQKEQDEVNS